MKYILFLLISIISGILVTAQDTISETAQGTVSAKIYSHFTWSPDPDNPTTSFEVKRAYFGYQRNLNDHFSGEVKLDIGSVNEDSEYSLIRRFTYFKNAYLSYRNGNIRTWFGLFDMLQFKVQEEFWGYRYLYKSYLDEYKFGSSADLGTGIQYTPLNILSVDLIISNGEGYANLQYDDVYRIGTGITYKPLDGMTLRTYYTVHTSEIPQMSFSAFTGYQAERWRMGGEFIFQKNYKFNRDHNRYGYSLYSSFLFAERWEVFARFDQLFSNILPENDIPWNLGMDGSAVIAGVQYTPAEFVHLSLNYQDWVEYAKNGSSTPSVYLSFEIEF